MCVYRGIVGNAFVFLCDSNECIPNMRHYVQYALVIYLSGSSWHWSCTYTINYYLLFYLCSGCCLFELSNWFLFDTVPVCFSSSAITTYLRFYLCNRCCSYMLSKWFIFDRISVFILFYRVLYCYAHSFNNPLIFWCSVFSLQFALIFNCWNL